MLEWVFRDITLLATKTYPRLRLGRRPSGRRANTGARTGLDDLVRAYREQQLIVVFHEKRGSEYEDFFSEVMEKCHPGDFQRVRPWGREGDRKNDGYLRSQRILFQVYAPSGVMRADAAVRKIDEDFNGALPYWKQYFDTWVFVHNSRNGLNPLVSGKLLQLDKQHKSMTVTGWGFEEIRIKVFGLNEADLASLLGPAPSRGDMLKVGFDGIRDVVETIAHRETAFLDNGEIRPVPPDKLLFNDLSADVQVMLQTGMWKSQEVGDYFARCLDHDLGDNVARAFRREYERHKAVGMKSGLIFERMREFAQGDRRLDSAREAAVLAVIAYLFEQCEIFERPPKADAR